MTASSQRELSSQPSTCWRLDGTHAWLDAGALQSVVDVASPARGLAQLMLRGEGVSGWLMGVAIDAETCDAYVRGNDLVVAYRETPEQPFSVQIYWRVADAKRDGAVMLDATVSIQTLQWEAYPQVTMSSSLAGSEKFAIDASAILWRPTGARWSYAELSRPGDFTTEVDDQGDCSAWRFGEQFMERGVIRRLCLRGAFIPRANDQAAVERLRAEFFVEQPPLTA